MPGLPDQTRIRAQSHDPHATNGFGRRQQPSYYYSRENNNNNNQRPSPAQNKMSNYGRTNGNAVNGSTHTLPGDFGRRGHLAEDDTPSYWVEHLATFACGKQYALESAADGIRKLKDLEKKSSIWAQPMVLRLRPNVIAVEDENGELVEEFSMDLVSEPAAHLSTDSRDIYNNIVLFIVREDRRQTRTSNNPTEMHVFQCNRVSANEVVDDICTYLKGQFQRIRGGRRDTGFVVAPGHQTGYNAQHSRESSNNNVSLAGGGRGGGKFRDDISASSDESEFFERDVNTLNRCFDDIERFVARIQSAAIAQREMESQHGRFRGYRSRRDQGILQLRAQLPVELEFVDILQKFKLSFNLLAKLKNHIHEPNAPELLHFLFTPLTVILDASQWGLGKNIAQQVVSPLLATETKDLMKNCLTSKESDVWMALGDAWRIPPEDWPGPLPQPFRPVFSDGFMPYGPPIGQLVGSRLTAPQSVPIARRGRSVDNVAMDMDRMTLERDRIEFEREKMMERERRIQEEERRLRQEKQRVEAERRMMAEEHERRSIASERQPNSTAHYFRDTSSHNSPSPMRRTASSQPVLINGSTLGHSEQSPRQKAFLEDLRQRRCKIVQATYDRVAQNAKELTVTKGEFLEIMSDSKNWWECRNIHNRVGYVPHTILSVVTTREDSPNSVPPQDPLFIAPTTSQNSGPPSANNYSHQERNSAMHNLSISPRPETFEVQTAAVQAKNISYGNRNVDEQPKEPAPMPPPPPPGLQSQLNSIRLRSNGNGYHQSRPDSESSGEKRDLIDGLRRNQSPPENLVRELQATVGKGEGHQFLGKRSPIESKIFLSHSSTAAEISEWLIEKGFSMRTINVLEGQSGATLFALSKKQLRDFCGKEEGQRLYSQLLVQKNTTGYNTRSGAELKAILNLRKQKIETEKTPSAIEEEDTLQFVPNHTGAEQPATSSPVATYN